MIIVLVVYSFAPRAQESVSRRFSFSCYLSLLFVSRVSVRMAAQQPAVGTPLSHECYSECSEGRCAIILSDPVSQANRHPLSVPPRSHVAMPSAPPVTGKRYRRYTELSRGLTSKLLRCLWKPQPFNMTTAAFTDRNKTREICKGTRRERVGNFKRSLARSHLHVWITFVRSLALRRSLHNVRWVSFSPQANLSLRIKPCRHSFSLHSKTGGVCH